MTTDGDDELPVTDDPYVLLGVAHDADERTIKRAYARLIKRWRPDRAPEEFRKIQAAYEAVQSGWRPPPRLPALDPLDAGDAPREEAIERRAHDVARALVAARLREDHREVNEVFARAMDEGIPAIAILEATPPEHHSYLVGSPALTWARIAETGDPALVASTLGGVLAIAIHLPTALRAFALLQDPQLVRAAALDARLAAVCLRSIASLAWRAPGAYSQGLVQTYAQLPDEPALQILLAKVRRDADLSWRCWGSRIGMPGPMIDFFRIAPLENHHASAHALVDLADHLRAQPSAYLLMCDRATRTVGVVEPLGVRLRAGSLIEPGERSPDSVLAAMARRLRAHNRGLLPRLALAVGLLAAAVTMVFVPASVGYPMSAPVVGGMCLWVVFERRRYPRVRAEVAAVMAGTGASAEDVGAWVVRAGWFRAIRYRLFASAIFRDPGLGFLSQIVQMVTSLERRIGADAR